MQYDEGREQSINPFENFINTLFESDSNKETIEYIAKRLVEFMKERSLSINVNHSRALGSPIMVNLVTNDLLNILQIKSNNPIILSYLENIKDSEILFPVELLTHKENFQDSLEWFDYHQLEELEETLFLLIAGILYERGFNVNEFQDPLILSSKIESYKDTKQLNNLISIISHILEKFEEWDYEMFVVKNTINENTSKSFRLGLINAKEFGYFEKGTEIVESLKKLIDKIPENLILSRKEVRYLLNLTKDFWSFNVETLEPFINEIPIEDFEEYLSSKK